MGNVRFQRQSGAVVATPAQPSPGLSTTRRKGFRKFPKDMDRTALIILLQIMTARGMPPLPKVRTSPTLGERA
jgi:hypothetical protein